MKYKFEMESENFEQDVVVLIDALMDAFERHSKIEKKNDVSDVQKQVHGLDNRIDGLEALLKQNFKEVQETKIYSSSDEYKEAKKK